MSPISEQTRARRESYDPQPSHRWNGTSRPAPLDEALPNTPDPAVGVSGLGIALGIVGAVAAVVGCWHGLASWLSGVPA